jgi:hypothetical protein
MHNKVKFALVGGVVVASAWLPVVAHAAIKNV